MNAPTSAKPRGTRRTGRLLFVIHALKEHGANVSHETRPVAPRSSSPWRIVTAMC